MFTPLGFEFTMLSYAYICTCTYAVYNFMSGKSSEVFFRVRNRWRSNDRGRSNWDFLPDLPVFMSKLKHEDPFNQSISDIIFILIHS
jgi:hypothetical protein